MPRKQEEQDEVGKSGRDQIIEGLVGHGRRTSDWFRVWWSQGQVCGTGIVFILKSALWLQGRELVGTESERP